MAALAEGETVLIWLLWGGIDVFLSARRVGPRGKASLERNIGKELVAIYPTLLEAW